MTILILGARAPIALEMARSFGAKGCRVILADSLHLTVARWSNRVSKYYLLPAPAQQLGAFRAALQRIVAVEKVTHLIPTCEEAFYVAMCRGALPCQVWTVDIDLMHRLHRKDTFIEMAATCFAVPNTINAADFQDFKRSDQYVFKPIYSRFAHEVLIRPTAEQVKNIANPENWVCQEFVFGKEVCVYSVWENGRMRGYSAYHPKYRAGQGAGIYFEPFYDVALPDAVQHFGEKTHYHGQLSFDFILRPDGTPVVLECNPRGVSGAHLLGENLADCFLLETSDLKVAPNLPKTISAAQAKALKLPLLLTRPYCLFQRDFYRAQDVVFRFNDPLPMLLQPLSLLELLTISLLQKISILKAATWDIEWNGQKQVVIDC